MSWTSIVEGLIEACARCWLPPGWARPPVLGAGWLDGSLIVSGSKSATGSLAGWMILCADLLGATAATALGRALPRLAPSSEIASVLDWRLEQAAAPWLVRGAELLLDLDREQAVLCARWIERWVPAQTCASERAALWRELDAAEREAVGQTTACAQSLASKQTLSLTRGFSTVARYLLDPDPIERLDALRKLPRLLQWFRDENVLRIEREVGEALSSACADGEPVVRQEALRASSRHAQVLVSAGALPEARPHVARLVREGWALPLSLAHLLLCEAATGAVGRAVELAADLESLAPLGRKPLNLWEVGDARDMCAVALDRAVAAQLSWRQGVDPCSFRPRRQKVAVTRLDDADLEGWLDRSRSIHDAAISAGADQRGADSPGASYRARHHLIRAQLEQSRGRLRAALRAHRDGRRVADLVRCQSAFTFDSEIELLQGVLAARARPSAQDRLARCVARWIESLRADGAVVVAEDQVDRLVDQVLAAMGGAEVGEPDMAAVVGLLMDADAVEEVFVSDEELLSRLHAVRLRDAPS